MGSACGQELHGRHGDVVAVHDPEGIEIRLYTTEPPKR